MGRSVRWTEAEELALCQAAVQQMSALDCRTEVKAASCAQRIRDSFLKLKPHIKQMHGWKELDVKQELNPAVHWEARSASACRKAWLKISSACLRFHESLEVVRQNWEPAKGDITEAEQLKLATFLYNGKGDASMLSQVLAGREAPGQPFPHLAAHEFLRRQNLLNNASRDLLNRFGTGECDEDESYARDIPQSDATMDHLQFQQVLESFTGVDDQMDAQITAQATPGLKRKLNSLEPSFIKPEAVEILSVSSQQASENCFRALSQMSDMKKEFDARTMQLKWEQYQWYVMSHPEGDQELVRKFVRLQQESVVAEMERKALRLPKDEKVRGDDSDRGDSNSCSRLPKPRSVKKSNNPYGEAESLSADCNGDLGFGKCGCKCRGS